MRQYASGKLSTGNVSKATAKPNAAKFVIGTVVGVIIMIMILSAGA